PPVPANDVIWVSNSTAVTLSTDVLLANDHDVDGLALKVTGLSVVPGGTSSVSGLTVNPDGTFSFTSGTVGGSTTTPGTVFLNYTVSDGAGGTSTGTATLNVVTTDNGPNPIDLSVASVGAYQGSYIDG